MAKRPAELESAEGGGKLIEDDDEFMTEVGDVGSDDETDTGRNSVSVRVDSAESDDDEGDSDEESSGDFEGDEDSDVTEDELRHYSKSVQKRINSLTAKHHTERRYREQASGERDEASRLAEQLVNENNRLKQLLNKGEHVLVDEAKNRLTSELKSTQNALTTALDAGDSEAITAAQSELARVMAQQERVNSYRPQELQPTAMPAPSPSPQADPKAEQWKTKNRWFGRDEEMTAYAMGLHQRLVNKDYISPESAEYYQEIDENVRLRFPERFKGTRKRNPGRTMVAPAQRSSARTRSVTLNEHQVRLAKRLGITPEVYAAEYLKENPDG